MPPNRRMDHTMPRIRPTKIAHIFYCTRRFEQMVRWYRIVFDASVQYEDGAQAFLTYDNEHHRFAIANMTVLEPEGTEADKLGVIGVDHVAYAYASLEDLFENYAQLKEKGIVPHKCIHHGVSVSMYYADPDGNLTELQVNRFGTPEEAQTYMRTPDSSANWFRHGVEFDPDVWRLRVQAGVAESDFLTR
jgi:catechol-2,3-dioxygenase